MSSDVQMQREPKDLLYADPQLHEFFQVWVDAVGAESCAHIVAGGYGSFALSSEVTKRDVAAINGDFEVNGVKIAVFDLPINWRKVSGKYRNNHEFDSVLSVLPRLSDQSIAFLTTGASGLGLNIGQRFQHDLFNLGWTVSGYIELPKNGLNVPFQPLLAIISKKENDGLFTASISDSADETIIATSLLQNDPKIWKDSGFITDTSDFRGFRVERIRSELRSLLNSESGFQLTRLGEFVLETTLQRRKQPFELGKTQVAISRILGATKRDLVLTSGDKLNFTHEWVVASLKDELLPSYFKMFMNSELGQMCLETAADGSVLRFVNVQTLLETLVPIPSLDVQQSLVSAHDNLEKLQSQITRLEKELVFNPRNVDAVSSDVLSLLGSIGRLTIADEIKALVRSGENKTTEFKETLSWDIRMGEKAKHIEKGVLKTIAGFLNTDGGTLLIGVNDKGEIPGMEFEINTLHRGDADKFLLHFKNLVKEKLGEKFYPTVEWSLEKVDDRRVLVVKTAQGTEPAFIDDVFYVRTNPATDQLQGERLYKYLAQRFKGDFT